MKNFIPHKNIVKIETEKDNSRCRCDSCDHHILKVYFSDGSIWCPTNKEFTAIKQMLRVVLCYNLANDKYCYKAEQEVSIKEVLV
jgi:hypothetical protein